MPLTRQEMYDRVRAHFTQEGAVYGYQEEFHDPDDPEAYEEASCVYRGGRDPASQIRCAFGVLIPDEAYSPQMENNNTLAVFGAYPELFEKVAKHDSRWVQDLQSLHDSHAMAQDPIGEFLTDLDTFARFEGLTVPS